MYYFVFVYSAEMGKFHFLVELQAPLLLFTGPNMHGCLSQGARRDFNTSFFANLNWFSSLLPAGRGGCRVVLYTPKPPGYWVFRAGQGPCDLPQFWWGSWGLSEGGRHDGEQGALSALQVALEFVLPGHRLQCHLL